MSALKISCFCGVAFHIVGTVSTTGITGLNTRGVAPSSLVIRIPVPFCPERATLATSPVRCDPRPTTLSKRASDMNGDGIPLFITAICYASPELL